MPVQSQQRRRPVPARDGADSEDSLQAIGEHFGVSRERARQIEAGALDRVRVMLIERLGADVAKALARDAPTSPPITRRRRR